MIGCKNEEIDNELVGTQWEQVESYSSSGMRYYPDGNWWGQYHQVISQKNVIIFLNNHNGKISMKQQISTTAQNKTDKHILFDEILDFTYKYDRQNKRGELTYIYDSQDISIELNYILDKEKEEFGLFFDSDDFWLGKKTNIFVLSK